MKQSVVFILLISFFLVAHAANNYIVGGYFPNWAEDLACHKLPVSQFNSTPYTHIWYAFADVNTNTWAPSAGGDENGGVLTQLANLKKSHTTLKVLVSFGGGGQDKFFQPLTSSAANRQKFISQVIPWVRTHNLDGIDLDWEFPTGSAANNFATLFSELRTAINQEHTTSGKEALLLTVASFGDTEDLHSWPLAEMAKSLDWFNIMTYEEHGPWDKDTPTGINSPINSDDGYNIADCVKGYASAGVPASKLVLGAPTFAHSWVLKNANNHGIGAPGAGVGPAGKCTKDPGNLAYFEVKDLISEGATVVWDTKSQTPYLYKGTTWVSYENPQSFRAKATFAIQHQMRGLFVWDIDEDDNNELLSAAALVFKNATTTTF